MPAAILATKLYLPPVQANLVVRARLRERLNGALKHRLTLISAPAGFGKTTLVSAWGAELERPAAWLSLDRGDNDPARFVTYLIAALQKANPNLGEGMLEALQSAKPPSVDALLTALLNRVATLANEVFLVLDDYHLIEADAVDRALSFVLEHLPPQLHLIITTRQDPPLPLARLRARGQLLELRAADLRFTPTEASEFLKGVMGLTLSAEDVAGLETRTEGWIAGLQLAALSLRGRADAAHFIQNFSGSHRFVLDYLLEEVLERQPEHVRNFLLQTAILSSLSAPLCDAVTKQQGSQAMLEHLERRNLFLVPLDDDRNNYRYHHLFAEMLQARATTKAPYQLPRLHQRASRWYEQNGFPPEAIHHALAAADVERAADLIERDARAMLLSRQDATLLGWLTALPDNVVRARPVLSVYYALALVSVELENAEPHLQNAEAWLDKDSRLDESSAAMVVIDEAGFRSLPGIIAITRAYRAGALGDAAQSVAYAQRAGELLPEDDYLWRGAVGALLGLAHWTQGDLEAAYRAFTDSMASLQQTGDITQELSATFILGDIRTAQGRLREAQRLHQQTLTRAANHGKTMPLPAADLYVGLSELSRERNELKAALGFLQKSRELSEHGGIAENRHRWFIARARLEEAHGDLEGALEQLEEAERVYIRSPDPCVRPIPALRARLWLRQGRLRDALTWVRERGLSAEDTPSYLREFEHITLARVLLAQYQREPSKSTIRYTIHFLQRHLKAAEAGGWVGSVIEILVLQALAHEMQGQLSPALEALSRALHLAEPEGYVRIFVDEGQPIARLLEKIPTKGPTPRTNAYRRKLLASFERGKASPPTLYDNYTHWSIEPLSRRELEVLELVAQGLSNQEISQRLHRALSTIKGHNRIIFDKLQVKNRTEAVARARELKLL